MAKVLVTPVKDGELGETQVYKCKCKEAFDLAEKLNAPGNIVVIRNGRKVSKVL